MPAQASFGISVAFGFIAWGGLPGTKLSHALWEAVMEAFARRFRGRGEKTNERAFGRSLCPRAERRRRRRATEQRDELAPPNAKCHLIPPA
jgi:hypothetical protein